MDGFAATRILRSDPRLKKFPIIAMTAHAMVEERQRCLDVGMNDHVAKPIDPERMVATLQRWIAKSREPVATQTPTSTQAGANAVSTALPAALPGIDLENGLWRC